MLLWMVSAWQQGKRPAYQGAHSSVRSSLDWASLYLPADHPMTGEARTYLLVAIWASVEGESFRDICRRRGWSRTTVARWSKWALDHIVDGLDEADQHARAAE